MMGMSVKTNTSVMCVKAGDECASVRPSERASEAAAPDLRLVRVPELVHCEDKRMLV